MRRWIREGLEGASFSSVLRLDCLSVALIGIGQLAIAVLGEKNLDSVLKSTFALCLLVVAGEFWYAYYATLDGLTGRQVTLTSQPLLRLIERIFCRSIYRLAEKHLAREHYRHLERRFYLGLHCYASLERGVQTRDIFVRLSLLSAKVTGAGEASDEGQFVRANRSLRDLLNTNETFNHQTVLLGGPGAGKTCLALHLASCLAKEQTRSGEDSDALFPVLLSLHSHAETLTSEHPPELHELLASEDLYRIPNLTAEFFSRRLASGRCLVIFDHLDGISHQEERRKVFEWLNRQLASNRSNHFLFCSRPTPDLVERFRDAAFIRISPMSTEEMKQLLAAWRTPKRRLEVKKAAEESAAQIRAELHAVIQANSRLTPMSRNPLILKILAKLYDEYGELPERRSDVFARLSESLLRSCGDILSLVGTRISPILAAQEILGDFAFWMMRLRRQEINEALATTILCLCRRSEHPSSSRTADFLEKVAVQSGLLLYSKIRKSYRFTQQSLQAYFAARSLAKRSERPNLRPLLLDAWWQETILFYSEMAGPEEVMNLCLDAPDDDQTQSMKHRSGFSLVHECLEGLLDVNDALRSRAERLLSKNPDRPNIKMGSGPGSSIKTPHQ